MRSRSLNEKGGDFVKKRLLRGVGRLVSGMGGES